MNVRDWMTTPAVTVAPSTPVSEVARILLDGTLAGVAVVQDGALLGVVTDTDLVMKHAQVHLPKYFGILGTWLPLGTHHADEEMRRVLGTTAADLMTADVPVVAPDDAVEDAASIMVEQHMDPLPVVENGVLVGLLGHADIIKILLVEAARDSEPGP